MTIEKERLIYTSGTFKIDDNLARCRRLIIRSSVLRLPFSAVYRNERSNPPKYFLGYVSLFVGDYVHSIFPLEFEQQIVFLWDNLSSQIYARILCEALNFNANLVSLRVSIPLPGTLVPVPGDPNSFPGCPYNFIKFKLEPGARIKVTGVGEEVETCEGGEFETTVPDLSPPPPLYPDDQARDEDPARSAPEEGELPGDTAPATLEDPDASLLTGPVTVRALYRRDGTPGFPPLSDVTVDYEVPNRTYVPTLIAGTAPSACPSVQPQTSVARSPGNADIVLAIHNTCNLLTILSYEYL